MKSILAGLLILLLCGKSFGQKVAIPADKIAPVNIWSKDRKIKDTSEEFIKSSFAMNQRIWKIIFTTITYDEKNKFLQATGAASLTSVIDSFQLNNYNIHLCALQNDTIVNVKHLNSGEFIDKKGNFNVQFDLMKYPVLIFTSPHRLPRIFDFSFLLQ
jgi:hypothetical protein